jgi:MoaA/NifB/PqqE/SkfB family radical SAM enzyme
MHCDRCYASTFCESDELPVGCLDKALSEAHGMGVFHYVLQGGEPIMSPERLAHIIQHVHPDESYINVVSNGWDMTMQRIQWLRSLGVDKISYSMDSGIAEEHDRLRGQESFNRVVKAISDTLSSGLLSSISTVVTHDSLHSVGFLKAYEFAAFMGIRMDVQIVTPVGRLDGDTSALLTPDDVAWIDELRKYSKTLPNGQKLVSRDLFCAGGKSCPAVREFMAISVTGDFMPCNFLQFSLGNIRDKSLKEMRDGLLGNPWFQGCSQCLVGENKDFISRFITPNTSKPKPLDASILE